MIARKHALWALPGVHDETWQVPRLSCAAMSSRQFGITLVWVPYGQQLENVVHAPRMHGTTKHAMEEVMPLFERTAAGGVGTEWYLPDVEPLYDIGDVFGSWALK